MNKICILQNGLAMGGTDTFVVNLCNGISGTCDVTVVNPCDLPSGRIREDEVERLGVKIVHTFPLSTPLNILKHFYELYKILRDNNFSVFHTNIDLFNGPNLLVAWLAGVPIRCCHSHNTMQNNLVGKSPSMANKFYGKVMRWMCWTFSNRRCGCSESAMDFLFRGHDWRNDPNSYVVYNGIDIEKFNKKVDLSAKKSELGITSKYNLVTVGHMIEQKNPFFIAEIINKLCSIRKDCDLIWIGEGKYKKEIQEYLSDKNISQHVHFLSKRNDMHEILKCGDVFILPSIFEGLPIVSTEAQVAGLQVILSDTITKEADCGCAYYLPINQGVDLWTTTICDILDGKINKKISSTLIEKFSIGNMIAKMSLVFKPTSQRNR